MEDLEDNTTVFSTLRSFNNFISQRMEGVSGQAVPASSQSSLQLQYQQRVQVRRPQRVGACSISSRTGNLSFGLVNLGKQKGVEKKLGHFCKHRGNVAFKSSRLIIAVVLSSLVFQDLEQRFSQQEHDAVIVKNMKTELARFPKMERELRQLREENAYFREMKENNGLLKEEVEGLQRKLERYEKVQAQLVTAELENENGVSSVAQPVLGSSCIVLLESTCSKISQACVISPSARILEKARQQLQEEILQIQSQLLDEKKKREQHEALVRRLQKRVLLLTKERDGMRAILESYDSELTPAEHSPQLNRRMREAEEMVQKLHAHNAELELFVEGLGKDTLLTVFPFPSRLKIEELEAERSKLEEQNRSLEMKLEKLTMQGDYDPSKTKVLHFSMNPASLAKQQRKEEQQQLQEECERLRELVRVLEAGGSIHGNLEGVGSFQSPQEVAELKKQVESAELKNQRLKEIFQTKIQEFRKVCYTLTGYQIDITTENQYRLTSIYAEHQGDCLLFKASSSSGGKMQLLENEFSRTVRELIELHLLHQDSIPAFLSALTLELFSRQTIA
uniref:Mitotic spindle assembly checkpoint protein MAD1 n=1 Tax=Pavo cristatus TaxID=9049 RepID=A0A8C9ERK3_PAVCR